MNVEPEFYGRIVCAALLKDNSIYMGREGHHVIFPMEPIIFYIKIKKVLVKNN